MTRPAFPVALLLLLVVACASPSRVDTSGSGVDTSGLEPFWDVAEALRRGEDPGPERWAAVFATPGYATLVAHDHADHTLRALLPLAVSPARARERGEALAAGDLRSLWIEHLRRAVERRAELERFVEHLDGVELRRAARTLAATWLPPRATEGRAFPPVSLVLLEPDARGYERIVIDAALAEDLGADLVPTLAHEAHHVYRAALLPEPLPEGLPEHDLLAALENLQAEGVADQIDKRDVLRPRAWGDEPSQRLFARVQALYREAYARAGETLAGMDRLLAAYDENPGNAEELGRELRASLVLGGHPVGFAMATAIREALGPERLVEHAADPFAFVADYQQAALRLGGRHAFGAGALAGLERLRRAAGR